MIDFAGFFDPEWMFGIGEGFDVVIANPPYISHDKILANMKNMFRVSYKSYEAFADIYCYFIERAINLQNQNGVLSFVTSNSYLKTDYGAPLRRFIIQENRPLQIINIEDSQVFESAIVNVAILVSRKSQSWLHTACRVVNKSFSGDMSFDEFVHDMAYDCPLSAFSSKSWCLAEPEILAIQRKMESSGKTLEQLGAKIRLGLATGYNEAFIIDEAKRRQLCESDPINEEIIKPVLRGRDISRYAYDFPGLYILLAKNGINVHKDYPDIYTHLESFSEKFKNRGAQGQHWTKLRACSFFDDFHREKIVWIELTDIGRFALCAEEMYLLNSAYFLLPPPNLRANFLLGLLNSKAIQFYLDIIAETSGMGTTRWINKYVKEFPIPNTSPTLQNPINDLVAQVLAGKQTDPITDTSAFEAEIDRLVYDLYGLTEQEIRIVEESRGKG